MVEGQSTREILLQLEGVTGARIRSRREARAHVDTHLAERFAARNRLHRRLDTARNAAWLFMLSCAFLQYYTMDIVNEIVAMPSITPERTPGEPVFRTLLSLLSAAIG